jgi:hypothetical protein
LDWTETLGHDAKADHPIGTLATAGERPLSADPLSTRHRFAASAKNVPGSSATTQHPALGMNGLVLCP